MTTEAMTDLVQLHADAVAARDAALTLRERLESAADSARADLEAAEDHALAMRLRREQYDKQRAELVSLVQAAHEVGSDKLAERQQAVADLDSEYGDVAGDVLDKAGEAVEQARQRGLDEVVRMAAELRPALRAHLQTVQRLLHGLTGSPVPMLMADRPAVPHHLRRLIEAGERLHRDTAGCLAAADAVLADADRAAADALTGAKSRLAELRPAIIGGAADVHALADLAPAVAALREQDDPVAVRTAGGVRRFFRPADLLDAIQAALASFQAAADEAAEIVKGNPKAGRALRLGGGDPLAELRSRRRRATKRADRAAKVLSGAPAVYVPPSGSEVSI